MTATSSGAVPGEPPAPRTVAPGASAPADADAPEADAPDAGAPTAGAPAAGAADRRGVVVLGATGLVGGAVARALRADGVPVLAAGRDQDRLAALAHEGCATTRLGEPALLGQDVARFAATHGVQGVVAAIGGWWIGDRLLDLDPTTWEAMLASHLTAHLDAARTLAPHLPPGAAWVVLNGAASSEPMAHSGPVSVTGAGLHMLVEVLRAEEPPGGTRFHEVVVDHAIAGDDRNLDPAVEVPLDAVVATVLARLPHDAAPGVVHVPARA